MIGLYVAVFVLSHNSVVQGGIIYPTIGHDVIANGLINAKDVFTSTANGKTLFGTDYFQAYVSVEY